MSLSEDIVGSEECIICFEGSLEENKVEPIENIYIMPHCFCSYNIHSKCINKWQHIQSQQLTIYNNPGMFHCLKCNSPVILKRESKPLPENNYRTNNFQVVCVIICCIIGLFLLMLYIGLITHI
jgi:hypothetical protein